MKYYKSHPKRTTSLPFTPENWFLFFPEKDPPDLFSQRPTILSEVFGLGSVVSLIRCFFLVFGLGHFLITISPKWYDSIIRCEFFACGCSKVGYILMIFLHEVNMLKPRCEQKLFFSMCSFGVLTSENWSISCLNLIETFGVISQQTLWLTPDRTWSVKKCTLAFGSLKKTPIQARSRFF